MTLAAATTTIPKLQDVTPYVVLTAEAALRVAAEVIDGSRNVGLHERESAFKGALSADPDSLFKAADSLRRNPLFQPHGHLRVLAMHLCKVISPVAAAEIVAAEEEDSKAAAKAQEEELDGVAERSRRRASIFGALKPMAGGIEFIDLSQEVSLSRANTRARSDLLE